VIFISIVLLYEMAYIQFSNSIIQCQTEQLPAGP